MRVVVLGLVVAMVSVLGLLWLAQRRLVYFPDRSPVPAAPAALPGARDVELSTSDGLRLGAWLVAPASPPGRDLAVLVAPGNAGNRSHRVPLAHGLTAAGFTVLLVDYRGYGANPGTPSQQGLARDVRAARDYLTGPAGFAPHRIIYFGESLGAAVVTELAAAHPPAGLVLRSPFTDLAAVGRHHYPVLPIGALLRDRFPVADLVSSIAAPTVVVYGTADTVVPPAQSRRVGERAGALIRLISVDGADHNDPVLTDGAPVQDAVVEVADRISG